MAREDASRRRPRAQKTIVTRSAGFMYECIRRCDTAMKRGGCPRAFTRLMIDIRPMSERVRLLLLAHAKNEITVERAASK
ncbi:hypothetical protein EVAR_41475_1 [Eumeta japonica]|uniref:Uncharacterized protein n=1 Tax=Eumeta variegata TaxID=151549 RepID=A0A4C1X399_EUMVA|nr:hypothetical protein EVAR_41475_1 [Eumeta japonica]